MLSEVIKVFLTLPVCQGEVAHDGFFVAPIHVQLSTSHLPAFATAEPVKKSRLAS